MNTTKPVFVGWFHYLSPPMLDHDFSPIELSSSRSIEVGNFLSKQHFSDGSIMGASSLVLILVYVIPITISYGVIVSFGPLGPVNFHLHVY